MKTVGMLIVEAKAVAKASGIALSQLSLPRDQFEALKDECRQTAIFQLSAEDRYRFIYEPAEKIIYRGVEVTPQ